LETAAHCPNLPPEANQIANQQFLISANEDFVIIFYFYLFTVLLPTTKKKAQDLNPWYTENVEIGSMNLEKRKTREISAEKSPFLPIK
jgi:hypothetical protein